MFSAMFGSPVLIILMVHGVLYIFDDVLVIIQSSQMMGNNPYHLTFNENTSYDIQTLRTRMTNS